jgi:hypothetical protein
MGPTPHAADDASPLIEGRFRALGARMGVAISPSQKK